MSKHKIIDSHIHLYPESHLKTLAWAGDLPSDHALNQQLCIDEYRKATSTASNELRGFIFIETDRISKALPATWTSASAKDDSYPEPPEWQHPLDEISFLARIASGRPVAGEGHVAADSSFLLGFVPWAPITAGSEVLFKYHMFAATRCQAPRISRLLRGYRYLFQDKASGTMIEPAVIESLLWLGKYNLTFDLGVDARQGGLHQLREACEMLTRLMDSANQTRSTLPRIIINHLCKPNLLLSAPDALKGHPDFTEWQSHIQTLARFPNTYMKLSGGWSELPSQTSTDLADMDVLQQQIRPWTDVVFACFGPSRVLFGSDWPVCNVGGGGEEVSWSRWRELVERLLEEYNLGEKDTEMVWAGTAVDAYNLDV